MLEVQLLISNHLKLFNAKDSSSFELGQGTSYKNHHARLL